VRVLECTYRYCTRVCCVLHQF